jgi:SnoaL-like domain
VEEAKVAFGLTRKRIFSALTIALFLLGAFTFGFVLSLHLKSAVSSDLRQQYLLQGGDAPLSVRAGVLAALRDFQDGYVKRDPKELDAFMNRLFSKNDDILVLGTNAGEWTRGYPAVGEFIRADWLYWGDFRFAVDASIVWSSGDVAWIASTGAVHKHGSDRPLRFSAILTRHDNRWLFRQVHFQWDYRDPSPADLLRPSTDLKLVKWGLQLTCDMAQRAGRRLHLTGARTPIP